MLEISPKGTVPVLQLTDGRVVEESLEVLEWALKQSDVDGWNHLNNDEEQLTNELIAKNDGAFKRALDRYKYPHRYPEEHYGDRERFSIDNRDKSQSGGILFHSRDFENGSRNC
eukprot:CFRG4384T1